MTIRLSLTLINAATKNSYKYNLYSWYYRVNTELQKIFYKNIYLQLLLLFGYKGQVIFWSVVLKCPMLSLSGDRAGDIIEEEIVVLLKSHLTIKVKWKWKQWLILDCYP